MKQIARIFFAFICLITSAQAQNVLPQANLGLSPSVVRVGEVLHFDASGSRNAQGESKNLEYRFQYSKSESWTPFLVNPKGEFTPKKTGLDIFRVEIRDRVSRATQRTFRQYEIRPERKPLPPRIKLLTSPPFAAGEQIGFEVIILTEPSINKQDLKVMWDFNSDGAFDTPWQTDKRGFYAYQGGNLVSPTVKVEYPNGRMLTVRGIRSGQPARGGFDYARDVDKLTINPTRIQSPIVNVSPGIKAKSQDTTFTFDASKTQLGQNSYLEFYFDGVKKYTGKSTIKHRFQSPGEHIVRVRHCINRTNPECRATEVNVTVEDSTATVGTGFWADFTVNEVQPGVNKFRINNNVYQSVVSSSIKFNGRVNLTATGTRPKFEYRWDFDGNGTWDTPYAAQTSAEYTYDNHGNFRPVLEIRDDKGNVNTATKTMIVLKNTKPLGRIRTATWPVIAQEETQFQVQATDAQSSLSQLDVRFDFNGDGVWDTDFRPTTSQRWRFDQPGNYAVTVQIRDPQKEVTTVTRSIEVIATPAPKLKIEVSHRNQLVGQPIRLDASKSTGKGLSYEWKVLNDPYASVAQGLQTSLRFDTPGERTICLRVIDQAGNVEQINFPVTIVKALSTPEKSTTADSANTPKITTPTVAGAISEFETNQSEFAWSDYGLIDRPDWKLTGMRPGQ